MTEPLSLDFNLLLCKHIQDSLCGLKFALDKEAFRPTLTLMYGEDGPLLCPFPNTQRYFHGPKKVKR
jgi:hypothetical protein